MAANNKSKLVFLAEILESSDSSDEDELIETIETIIRFSEKEYRPKITNYVDIVEAYSENEVGITYTYFTHHIYSPIIIS